MSEETVRFPHELIAKYAALERAAIELSDALTGGGVFASQGRAVEHVLARYRRMEDGIGDGLIAVNNALRALDRDRKLSAPPSTAR